MTSSEPSDEQIRVLRSELERLTASFNAVADADGQITVSAFAQALELSSDVTARHLFRQFDRDGNGTIERDEFMNALEGVLMGSAEDKLAFLFRVHDEDENGTIERMELERLVQLGLAESALVLPEETIDEMIDALFEASDEDGDGQISYEEFAAVFAGYPELLHRVTRADSIWRALRHQADPARSQSAELSRREAISSWTRDHGLELAFVVVYAAVNVGLFTGTVLRYRADGAPMLVQIARGCGACLNFNCALILVPMLRHFLSWLRNLQLGRLMPIDHVVGFHKLVGHVIFGFAVVHTGAHVANYLINDNPFFKSAYTAGDWVTGVPLIVILCLMWAFALEPIRGGGRFQLFHNVHLLYWPFFVLLLVHGPVFWIWALAPLGGYLVERLLRVKTASKRVEVATESLPSEVTKLSFAAPAGWEHRAGDYLFLKLPDIARSEWHPFTISSAPEKIDAARPASVRGDEITLHVRTVGHWTSALNELARQRADSGLQGSALPPLEGRIDGPYGSSSAHIFESKYAVLVGVGIGVTPYAAILESILHRHQTGDDSSKLERVHFVWINRDQHGFEWFSELLAELEDFDFDSFLDIHIYMTGGRAHLDAVALELVREVFYAKTQRDVITGLGARTRFGRPDWEELLTPIRREHAPERVDVFFCGPGGLMRELRTTCHRLGMGFRHEVF